MMHVQDHVRTITHRVTKAALKVVAADTDTVSGKKSGRILIDELWVFGKRKGADTMLQEATGGMVSRPEGFVIYLSTQSDEPPAGVFKDKLDYARRVRDGEIEDKRFLPVIYEFPKALIKSQAYEDPKNFYVTNPNLGRSVNQAWLERELGKAREAGAGIQTFLAKHLNVEIGINLRANRWPGAEFWGRRADRSIILDRLFRDCDIIVPGIDGGGLDDLFGLTMLGREKTTRDWLAWSHAWCHEGVLDRRKLIAPKLLGFRNDGNLTIVDDELADISEIVALIGRAKDAGLLGPVAVDPAGLGEFIDALADLEIGPDDGGVIGAPQGYAMMNAIKTAERKLANGTLRHAGMPLMDWCVGNLKIEPTATAIRATKQSAGDAKIDPVMSLFDAVTVMSRNPEPKRPPTYQMIFV
jgi:phage terminase large subunit-like protein